jgi:hypothetical protein
LKIQQWKQLCAVTATATVTATAQQTNGGPFKTLNPTSSSSSSSPFSSSSTFSPSSLTVSHNDNSTAFNEEKHETALVPSTSSSSSIASFASHLSTLHRLPSSSLSYASSFWFNPSLSSFSFTSSSDLADYHFYLFRHFRFVKKKFQLGLLFAILCFVIFLLSSIVSFYVQFFQARETTQRFLDAKRPVDEYFVTDLVFLIFAILFFYPLVLLNDK